MINDENQMVQILRNQLALDYNCSVEQIAGESCKGNSAVSDSLKMR
jgi:hypothetical protein